MYLQEKVSGLVVGFMKSLDGIETINKNILQELRNVIWYRQIPLLTKLYDSISKKFIICTSTYHHIPI